MPRKRFHPTRSSTNHTRRMRGWTDMIRLAHATFSVVSFLLLIMERFKDVRFHECGQVRLELGWDRSSSHEGALYSQKAP